MKSTLILLVITFMMLPGCAVTQLPTEQPELVSMSALPHTPSKGPTSQLRINVIFHVRGDGTVADVRILGTSGSAEWDAAAVDSMKQWRFVAVHQDSFPEGRWIRFPVVVRQEEPMTMNLGRLMAANRKEADSLYLMLQEGITFDTLANRVRVGSSSEPLIYLGTIDIARYPSHVRDVLRKLPVSSFTHPLRVGNNYVIYKRLDPDWSENHLQ